MFQKIKDYIDSMKASNRFPAFANLSQLGAAVKKRETKEQEKDYTMDEYAQYFALACMLLVISYMLFFLSPMVKEIKQMESDLTIYQQDYSILDGNNKLLELYKDKNGDYKKLDLLLKRSIPTRSDIDQSLYFFQKDLLENKKLRGIAINSITVKDNVLVTSNGKINLKVPLYKIEYGLNIANVKSYEDVKGILEILEKNYRIYEVSDLKAAKPDASQITEEIKGMNLTLKFSSYYIKSDIKTEVKTTDSPNTQKP